MSESLKSRSLPHNARGIEVADLLTVEFGSDKAILIDKRRRDHYTLHAGYDSGVLDFHLTWGDEHGVERHKTLFAIRRVDLSGLLAELSPLLLHGYLGLVRRLRFGWLARNRIGVIRGLEFATNEDVAAVTTRNRRKRLVVEEEKVRANLDAPRYLEEVLDFPDGQPFSLFQGRRRIGLGWKFTDKFGRPRLFWLKLRDLIRFSNRVGPQLFQALLQHAIPQERYADYDGVLVPR